MTRDDLRAELAPLADELGALRREVERLRLRLGESTLSQKEVCALYGVSPSTVLRRQRAGLLTPLGPAKRPRYDAREAERTFRPRVEADHPG